MYDDEEIGMIMPPPLLFSIGEGGGEDGCLFQVMEVLGESEERRTRGEV